MRVKVCLLIQKMAADVLVKVTMGYILPRLVYGAPVSQIKVCYFLSTA